MQLNIFLSEIFGPGSSFSNSFCARLIYYCDILISFKTNYTNLQLNCTGQRCSGRNYGERRCCTPENPCDEGEGDCDGPGDGGGHDGHAGCKGDLVCGSNNCKKFGTYYHEKDDCCENPSSSLSGGSIQLIGKNIIFHIYSVDNFIN